MAAILAVTAYRLVFLPFATADLFVDETQYWQWGQALDWGYYSKPPLIGWVLRAVTDLAGSDAPFWVRAPGPVFHALTAALIIGAAQEITDRGAAVAAGLVYLTLPFVTVGAFLISTDTILLPFFAAAVWIWLRLERGASLTLALLLGLCLGLGAMAKYAAIYFLLGAAIGAILIPQARIAWRDALLAGAVFAVVIAPNVIWNLQNDLVTVSHTATNADWVGQALRINAYEGFVFFGMQFLVMGPVLFGAYLWAVVAAIRSGDWRLRWLVAMSAPILLLVLGQALLSRAYANWAVTAFVAASVLTAPLLWQRARGVFWVGLALNLAVAAALPPITLGADRWVARDGERLLFRRYLGRAETSAWILGVAEAHGARDVTSDHRDILADLFYTGRDSAVQVFSAPIDGPPPHYYAQMFPYPPGRGGPVLFVGFGGAPECGATLIAEAPAGPAYRGAVLRAWDVPPDCWQAP